MPYQATGNEYRLVERGYLTDVIASSMHPARPVWGRPPRNLADETLPLRPMTTSITA